jgi:ZIP family zinc transporter
VSVNAGTVAIAATLTALACGLGALPFLFARNIMRDRLGAADAAAGGAMLAATVVLAVEGWQRGPGRLLIGALIGVAFIAVTRRLLAGREHMHLGALRGADARTAITVIAVMTVHSVAEGVGVGVSFGGGSELGIFITAAIAIHNIPEGLAISIVLVPRGISVLGAAWWSVFSSLPQPLLAVPAYVFVEQFRSVLPAGLGFAAGAMAWLVAAELVPAARRVATPRTVNVSLLTAFSAMLALQVLLSRA